MLVAVAAGVPSLSHDFFVELFRQRPALAGEILSACAGIELTAATADAGSIDLSQVAPTEYRADWLTVLHDRRRRRVAAVIVEVQLQVDEEKQLTWPLYVSAARARLACPVMLLVLAPKRAVARWASRPIPTGHPGYVLKPIVVGLDEIPAITDVAAAREAPELAVLSAVARPNGAVKRVVRAALEGLPEDKKKLFLDLIVDGPPARMRAAVEASMKHEEFDLDRAERFLKARKARIEGMRHAILQMAGARFPALRDEIEERLREQPPSALERFAVALGKARNEAAMRGVLRRLPEPPKPPTSMPYVPFSVLMRRAHAKRAKPRAGRGARAGRAAAAPRPARTRRVGVSRRAAT